VLVYGCDHFIYCHRIILHVDRRVLPSFALLTFRVVDSGDLLVVNKIIEYVTWSRLKCRIADALEGFFTKGGLAGVDAGKAYTLTCAKREKLTGAARATSYTT
jgi:hypothetical protein